MLALSAGGLFDQHRMSTFGTRTVNGRIPDRVITIRILVAGVEELTSAGAFFHQFTLATFTGAFDPGRKRFGVLAVRIIGAGNEAAPGTGMLDDQIAIIAIGAFTHNLGSGSFHNLDLAFIVALKVLDVATIRITGTAEEFTAV